jgi:hypothetical protein
VGPRAYGCGVSQEHIPDVCTEVQMSRLLVRFESSDKSLRFDIITFEGFGSLSV